MTLCDEIRNSFTFLDSIHSGVIPITSLDYNFPAFALLNKNGFAVAIPYDGEEDFFENYHGATLETIDNTIDHSSKKMLMLSSIRCSLRNEFAAICAEFVAHGENGELRKEILKAPKAWWDKWKELFGNSVSEKKTYSIIAELMVLSKMYQEDKSLVWAAAEAGSHDIEGETCSYEVKSSLKRYGMEVTIAGQFQLLRKKPLHLVYCRMEKSKEGISINDVLEKLSKQGLDKGELNKIIERMGIVNTSEKTLKYKFNEVRMFEVNNDFPQITNESFKDGKTPANIKQIQYTVDLSNIKNEVIDL